MYPTNSWAVVIFLAFVAFVLWISYYFARRVRSAEGYFAAGGQIHWAVNGIAFAGDYLSAASFLGICGMIAVYGYDGFLYSIGYLAGWIVALFVVAEPMKRLGKYTFTDALDSKFNSRGIQFMAALSTLIVSMFYLIPQMVGAGVLVTPLLGLPHWVGVSMVGAIVIIIVATAGMASTTYVQFLKGALLIIFSIALVIVALYKGLEKKPEELTRLDVTISAKGEAIPSDTTYKFESQTVSKNKKLTFVELTKNDKTSWWYLTKNSDKNVLLPTHWKTNLNSPVKSEKGKDCSILYDGKPILDSAPLQNGFISTLRKDGEEVDKLPNLGLSSYIQGIKESTVVRYLKDTFETDRGKVTVFYPEFTSGRDIMRPGLKFKVDEERGATGMDKLNFASLMLALFCGTAALPHILIRYYTVPTPAAARKSTIIAIAAIGLFYMLTLFMGLGAMTNSVVDLTDNNMSAPLLAKSFGITLFAIISAIAFATVLGTVSGLIVAASGAVAHDLMDRFFNMKLTDKSKVAAGKITAIVVGVIAICLGILFQGINVSYLVGWAFAVAASANLPAILMLLFWKGTTKRGITVSIVVGIISSVGLILLSPDMFAKYGLSRDSAPFGLNNPGIISIPLSFITLVVVSLMTKQTPDQTGEKTAVEIHHGS